MNRRQGKVLIIGPAKVGDMAWFLALAYRRLGWVVDAFDDRAYVSRKVAGKPGLLLQMLERDHHLTGRTRRLTRELAARALGCDHVVTIKGEYLSADQVSEITAVAPFLNWHPDHPVLDQQFAAIAAYSAFCPKDSWSTQRLRDMGHLNVTTLPHSSDPEVLWGQQPEVDAASMSLVGNLYAYREHWIAEATALGLAVNLWGINTHKSPPGVAASGRPALGAEQGEALRQGSFTLNTHHPHDVAGGNQRLFDAAAAGAPQLTERLPETLRHFKADSEIATFEDRDEFRSQVLELVGSKATRERLAANSHERLREEHTYEHRIATILTLL
jgi:spore maturation protein CgeB